MPIGIAIAILIAIVTMSYRQTIYAYPKGGGSYIVAKENLGTVWGLVAAASILTDYVLDGCCKYCGRYRSTCCN